MAEGKLVWAVLCLVLLGLVCGCGSAAYSNAPQTNPSILLKAGSGISQAKLETLLQLPARDQFTVSRSNSTVRCVSYYFRSYNHVFFFVFTNDALGKIALRPD